MTIHAIPATDGKPSPMSLLGIDAELARVEALLQRELTSTVRTVMEVSRHILDAGGKRLRPSLVILSARACGGTPDVERVVAAAAGSELIHMATLVHDDVIDEAESRRGRATANSCWGNRVSILAGDYMLAKATSLFVKDVDVRIVHELARATTAMAEGEIAQIESQGDVALSQANYLNIIRAKTAEFMSACCRIGAIVGGGLSAEEDALGEYGLYLGIAFQITDDLLDLIGDPAITGKPVGGDLREGKITLPVILALERADSAGRTAVEAIIGKRDATTEDVSLARGIAESAGAVQEARRIAAEYVDRAKECLSVLPSSAAKNSLVDIADYILGREK